eukprot:3586408-Alexandrium_andersonii.AAC.1
MATMPAARGWLIELRGGCPCRWGRTRRGCMRTGPTSARLCARSHARGGPLHGPASLDDELAVCGVVLVRAARAEE